MFQYLSEMKKKYQGNSGKNWLWLWFLKFKSFWLAEVDAPISSGSEIQRHMVKLYMASALLKFRIFQRHAIPARR